MASALEKAKVGALGFISLAVLVVLVLNIVTFVNVNQDDKNVPVPTTAAPTTTTTEPADSALHIRPRKKIEPDLDTIEKFAYYKSYSETLKESLNTTYDPCDNFYEYACGSFNQPMDFSTIQYKNALHLLNGLKKDNSAPYAQKTKLVFNECLRQAADPKYVHRDGATVKQIFDNFSLQDQYWFPTLKLGDEVQRNVPHFLGTFLGTLKRELKLSIFVSSSVNTNWKRPQVAPGTHKKSYLLYLDQPTLTYDDVYYKVQLNETEVLFKDNTFNAVTYLAKLKGITVDDAEVKRDVAVAWELEKFIAENVNVGAEERRKYERAYNIHTADSANEQFKFLDFHRFLIALTAASNASRLVQAPDFEFNVNEPAAFEKLAEHLQWKVAKRDLMNYVNFRVLLAVRSLLPSDANIANFESKSQSQRGFNIGFRRGYQPRRPLPIPFPEPAPLPSPGGFSAMAADQTELRCALRTAFKVSAATTRLYLDEALPKANRKEVKSKVALLVNNVIEGFQYQLDRLDWMSTESKKNAYDKINYLVKNLVYPDWVEDDDKLNAYYKDLNLDADQDYLDFTASLARFDRNKEFSLLASEESVERDDFLMSMSIVNAWYQAEVNSITIPYGILQAPFFHVDYPMAANLGAIGVIAGHELTHGFDDEGSQYDGVGALRTWMDERSQRRFDAMAQCVIGQYAGFEPFPGLFLDGANTQGENIADNGGIRAAFNALASYEAYYGPDAALPDDVLSGFSNQQIFFLSFARAWCEIPPERDDVAEQIRTDPHAPSKYRVLGSIQNFPAFREAFNCPAETAYAPRQHCNVWASEVSDNNGVPQTPEAVVDIGIRPIRTNRSEEFNAVSSRVADNIDLDVDPCEHFYEYACRRSDATKPLEEAEILVDQAVEKFLATTKLKDEAIEKARKFLKTCESTNASSVAIQTVLNEIEDILRVHINFTHPSFNALDPTKLVRLSYLFAYKYDVDLFFHLSLRPNLKKEPNTAPYLLYLEQPELLFKPEVYKSTSAQKISREFEEYTTQLIKAYYKTDEDISSVVRSSLKMEEHLAQWISEENDVTDDNFDPKSLTELASDYPKLRLQDNFELVAQNEGIFVAGLAPYLKNHRTKVVNPASKFLKKFSEFVEDLSGKNVDDFVRYIALKAILKLQRFVPREHDQLSLEVRKSLDQEIFAMPSNGKSCLKELHHFLPVEYTTAATLGLYRNETELAAHQRDVAKIADYIFIEFERQLEGISWMPLSSRQKAIKKVRAVTRNIGVPFDVSSYDPQGVEQSGLAVNGSASRSADKGEHFLQWSDAVLMKRLHLFATLLKSGNIRRDSFLTHHQRKATRVALFSHDLNSVSVSLAALQPPVYNRDYPMAWNFATVGSLIAEQLAHLFDASGLDHDELGQLRSWMDTQSKDIVKSQLEELRKQHAAVGIDDIRGSDILAQTLGATLAYRALVSWNEFHGEQGHLSHPIFRTYNSEQLFFLLYAQNYCAPQPNRNITLVYNMINSGNLGHVFHCPSTSKLGRKQRIALYETDVDGFVGVPYVATRSADLNIPKASPEYSAKYQECAAAFENSVDITADPCNDFYQYTCGNYPGDSPFTDIDAKNTIRLVNDIMQVREDDHKVITLEKLIFAQCKQGLPRFDQLNADAQVLKAIVAELESVLGQRFPLTANNTATALSAEQIGKAMGFLSGKHGIGALLDVMIYTNVRAPEKGYSIYISSGYYLLQGYLGYTEEEIVAIAGGQILQYLNAVMDVTNETVANVEEEVRAFIMIEGLLIDSDNPSRKDKRNASEKYPQTTLKELLHSYPTPINFRSFMEGIVSEVPEAIEKVTSDTFDVGIVDPQNLRSFLNAFEELLARDDLKPQNLVNYLFYHVLMLQHGGFLPPAAAAFGARRAHDFHKKLLWERRLPKPDTDAIRFPEPGVPLERNPRIIAAGITPLDVQCMQIVTARMQEATNALFVEVTYPDKKRRLDDRLGVAKFADSIMVGFRTMLDQLNWMKPESKVTAYKKIDLLVKNIAYPNMSIDPVELEAYHKELLDSDIIEHNFAYALHLLLRFNMKQAVKELLKPVYDRTTFGSAFRLNAWYQPAANSITLPASILQQPFYDAEWPDSVNFGSIGAVAGHELVHGFDDSGVQWDAVGRLQSWIDAESFKSFRQMADCVVDEYTRFCYADGSCVDGANTQGENIADNGGIQAAYRAYRSAVGVNGPDAALPSKLLGRFTFDQLFFLSFGRTWCNGPISADRRASILKDVHSPPEFRVLGTLQNFPAFRDAFNCPLESAYAPAKHCQVWITDIEPSLAVPTPIPPKALHAHFKNIKKNQTELVV